MELDLLLIVALIVVVAIFAVLAFGLLRPTTITLIVGPGRQVTVGGTPYPASGPASGHERFVVPRSAATHTGDDIVLAIQTYAGETAQPVSVSRRRLRALRIDAGLESSVVVYGEYEPPLVQFRSYAMQAVPKCIWCSGGIIVCGIDPRCR
jgi:hypothetical protein